VADDLFLRIRLQVQDAASQAVKALGGNMEALGTVAKAGLGNVSKAAAVAGTDISKLSKVQLDASVAGKKLEVAQASAAVALKKADDIASGGKASTEQLTLAQARAALAAEKVKVAENGLASAVQKASAEMQDGGTKVSRLGQHFASLEGTIQRASGGFLNFASKIGNATTGIKNIAGWAISAGQALLEPIASAEQLGISFTTLLGGSQKAASELIKTLNHFADITPFEPGPVQGYAAQLIGMGIDAKKTIPIMTSLGDALFGIGHGTEAEMASVVDQIGKIQVAGVATWGDISQLQTHGIDALGAMSLATGKTKEALRDLAGHGGIPAKEAIDALTKGIEMNPLYKGGMAKQSASLSGILSTLSGYLKTGLNSFLGLKDGMIQTGGIIDRVKGGIAALGTIVSGPAFQQFAITMGEKVGGALQVVAQFVSTSIVPAFVKLAPIVQDIGQWFMRSFQNTMPIIQQFGAIVGQVFGNIVNWLSSVQFSNLLADFETLGNQIQRMDLSTLQSIGPIVQDVLGALGSILTSTVIPAIDTFVFDLGQMLEFFNENSVQAQIIKDLLIGIGVAFAAIQIGAFLATLPALIAGFIAWGIAAWSAAAGVIAATWPLLLIGAAIALVVAGIILAVQHWGDITKFLQGVWAGFTAWFMSAMGATGSFFTNVWNGIAGFFVGIWNKIVGFFVGLWNGIITGIKNNWNTIVNIIKIGAMLALAVIFFPITAIAALFIWLYNHNYYFKALVDAIVRFFIGCFVWLQGAWTATIAWLVMAWTAVVGFATTLWAQISGAIQFGFSAAIGFVAGVWAAISSFFVNAWNSYIAGPLVALWGTVSSFFSGVWANYIVAPLTALWTNVSTFFRNAWTNYVSKPISDLWNQLSTTVGGWGAKALDWGKNLIQSFINGIIAKAAAVGTALADTAKKIASFLGFHSPTKEGPGSEADQWAPNFVKMYAKGLTDNLPLIQSAVNKLSTPIGISALKSSNTSVSNSFVGKSSSSSSSSSGGSAGGPVVVHQTFNINVTTQGGWSRAQVDDLTKQVEDKLSRKLRGSGILTTQTSGGAQ
jgi:tape measure domain-containing protein